MANWDELVEQRNDGALETTAASCRADDTHELLHDTSFGETDAVHPLQENRWGHATDDGLQCLLCTSDDHLLPRLDIAVKLEPVVGEHISKSVLLCTACDLMMERYLSLEKEVAELQLQIQVMYQNNKEIEAARAAALLAATEATVAAAAKSQPEAAALQPPSPSATDGDADLPGSPSSAGGESSSCAVETVRATEPAPLTPSPVPVAKVVPKEAGEVDCLTSHQCGQCGKNFSNRTHRKQHAKSHAGESDHRCDICGLFLSSKAGWRNHMRRHRTDQTFQCQQCPRSFQKATQYRYHVKVSSLWTRKERRSSYPPKTNKL